MSYNRCQARVSCRVVEPATTCAHGVAVDDPIQVSADAVLLFDGVFLFRSELNALGSSLLVHDPATSVSRAVERDQGPDAAADVVCRKYELRTSQHG
jgi:hypothetical protein